MRAMPARTLLAPTPMFLIVVGYSSAVKTGITAFEELINSFPANARPVLNHLTLLNRYGNGSVSKHATPEKIIVKERGHLRPIRNKKNMLTATAGISTIPANI